MTLEQIVSTHPCPIIRAKIMYNVDKNKQYNNISEVIGGGFQWYFTKEGSDFWDAVYMGHTATYNDLKHLDNNYVAEPAKPHVMWRKIDKDNLPSGNILIKDKSSNIHLGVLSVGESGVTVIDAGNYYYTCDTTEYYIPLSELINLPIEA